MKIPFDSLVLAAVRAELAHWVGAKIQRITQPSEFEVVLELYGAPGTGMLLFSCHPEFFRAGFVTRKSANPPAPPTFCTLLRSRVPGARIQGITQPNHDRILALDLTSEEGEFRLVAELMAGASNLFLLDSNSRILGMARRSSSAARSLRTGGTYVAPSSSGLPVSKFLKTLLEVNGRQAEEVYRQVDLGNFTPILSRGHGAYPLSVSPLALEETPRATISLALEQHYADEVPRRQAAQLKSNLLQQLGRVRLAREVAVQGLEQAICAGEGASKWQQWGELIQAFGGDLQRTVESLEVFDYEGNPLLLRLDAEKTLLQNANAYFEKARRAKARLGTVRDQRDRLGIELAEISDLISRVETVDELDALKELNELARTRRWLNKPGTGNVAKEERPYEGHRVRELSAPGGFTVLYGENAESNDYLTLRVAKPNDIWLHVRGATSAHVIIQTRNQPDRVQRETLQFAAKVAVQNSTSKHAGYVPVDYTLKKYVRKSKGAPKGTAFYTHEKTLHVDS